MINLEEVRWGRAYYGCSREETDSLGEKILEYVKQRGKVSMADIYADLECCDLPMYMAIHDLVTECRLSGYSPYDEDAPMGHSKKFYTIA